MCKKAAIAVLSAGRVQAGAYLMRSVQRYLPEYERYIVCLDTLPPKNVCERDVCVILSAKDFWDSSFLEKAFFYGEAEFEQVMAVKVLQYFFEREYQNCLLLDSHMFFCSEVPFLEKEYSPNTVVSVKIPPVYENEMPPFDFSYDTVNFFVEGMHLFCRGPFLDKFLVWAGQKFDYLFRSAVLPSAEEMRTGNLKNPEGSFYSHWLDYVEQFGCDRQGVRVPFFSSKMLGISDTNPQFCDFRKKLPKRILEEPGPFAGLFERCGETMKNHAVLSAYEYEKFNDGVKIFPLLRPYFIKNYRLKTACKGNPFACRSLFTDTTIITGEIEGLLVPAVLEAIYLYRADLASAFPHMHQEDREAFVEWFLTYGAKEYQLEEAYTGALSQNFALWKASKQKWQLHQRTLGARIQRRLPSLFWAKKEEPSEHPFGINLCGYIRGDFGIGEACRSLAEIIETQDIPMTIVEVANENVHSYGNTTWESKITNTFPYGINLMYTNAGGMLPFMESCSPQAFQGRYNIGYWAWELPELPDEWVPLFSRLDEVWTLSEFAAEAIRAKSPIPVFSLPPSVEVKEIDPSLTRKDFELTEDTFVFLTMYDVNSVIQRKNPQAVVDAFLQAFEGNSKVALLVKANMPAGAGTEEDFAFLNKLRQYENIRVFTAPLPKAKVNALIDMCDVFVSLHRSEGFGLGPAEAMYLGKPVVITGWSGNMEYSRADACYPVKYSLVKIEKDYYMYKKGMTWAEPDIEDASLGMKKLFEDEEYYNSLATKAKEVIRTQFSPQCIGKKMKTYLYKSRALLNFKRGL